MLALGHFGILGYTLGVLWGYFGITLGFVWDTLGLFWGYCGVVLGYFGVCLFSSSDVAGQFCSMKVTLG